MKKTFNLKSVVLSMAVAAGSAVAVVPATAQAGVSANAGVVSNYLWRGVDQNGGTSAVQGGIDYESDSGIYLGAWTSSLVGAYELDVYGGYAGSAGSLDYDIGYIYYAYPTSVTDIDFSEVYASVGFSGLTLGANMSVAEPDGGDTGDLYAFVSYEKDLSDKSSFGVLFGNQSYAESGADSYSHAQVSLSVEDFSFMVDKNFDDAAGGIYQDNVVVTVGYSKSIDF